MKGSSQNSYFMAEDGLRLKQSSSGLALILNSKAFGDDSQKTLVISSCDELGNHSVERTLEFIFNLPFRSLRPPTGLSCDELVQSILKSELAKLQGINDSINGNRLGVRITNNDYNSNCVVIDKESVCGDIRIFKPPLVVESLAKSSSARVNACVWKGKWMYEVILETAGSQRLGWATFSCLFTEYVGVGDGEDSYAFDGNECCKWNKRSATYGQSWVVGDVIGCCIDLDHDEISFYRNGVPLGVAFQSVLKIVPGVGFFPAVSLSKGERCDLNFGARPFKYPVCGFHPIQPPPVQNDLVDYLLKCLLRLFEVQCFNKNDSALVDKLRKFSRFSPIEELCHPISHGICKEMFSSIAVHLGSTEYIAWGPLVSFLLEVFGMQAPHDHASLDRVLDMFLEFSGSLSLLQPVMDALSCSCKTAPLVLMDCPYSGSYPYLAIACHMLRRRELMTLFWSSPDFEFLMEGFLSRKCPNKQDLELLMPSVWWPGSEDNSSESSMTLTVKALSGAIDKVEEVHRELCRIIIMFIPPTMPFQLRGAVFRTFLQNIILKYRGAECNLPPGAPGNSVLVSLYTVILHFLSEGFGMEDLWEVIEGPVYSETSDKIGIKRSADKTGADESFLHRGGQQSFPVSLFLVNDSHRADISRIGGSFDHILKVSPVNDGEAEVVQWEEGCMDDREAKITHSTIQKPCCCSAPDIDFARISKDPMRSAFRVSKGSCCPTPQRSAHVTPECSTGSLHDEVEDKPSTSDNTEAEFGFQTMQTLRSLPTRSHLSSDMLREAELLDAMLFLYQLGVAPNFKQASSYMSQQSQLLSLLDETDRQIRERCYGEQFQSLKKARNLYHAELIDCVRQCAWHRVSLYSYWKQRGMYATCMWTVQLLLVLSKIDSLFIYVPEFYVEVLVDSFHALRRSDPPFVPSAIFIKHGLTSFITFLVLHFADPRISSPTLRDLLLQSIQVLVQYREYISAFESNAVVVEQMPRALLLAFDNRSWIPVTNVLLQLFKGSGFGSSKHGHITSSVFQELLRQAFISDEALFSTFLNRLFNTLSWTVTEFSVSVREMQEKYQVTEVQQRKCSVIFDLSRNLARILEFCTLQIPQAFLLGPGMNLQRLTELIVFVLSHITTAADSEFFDLCFRRQGQSAEKINRGMILAPLVGMIVNLLDASSETDHGEQNDIMQIFASMECHAIILCGFQYLLDYNWLGFLRVGDDSIARLGKLEKCLSCLRSGMQATEEESVGGNSSEEESCCCICYACEPDALFEPCRHISCFGCISRHLLNSSRCFFCNATVIKVVKVGK